MKEINDIKDERNKEFTTEEELIFKQFEGHYCSIGVQHPVKKVFYIYGMIDKIGHKWLVLIKNNGDKEVIKYDTVLSINFARNRGEP